MEKNQHPDADMIRQLGGPAAVARELSYSIQRVQNWTTRGVPAAVKLAHPDMFLLKGAA